MSTSPDTKEIVRAIKGLTEELKRLRKLMQSWDKEPELDDEADPEEYML